MPIDLRKLIFSESELRSTFDGYCREKGMDIPNSAMESFMVIKGGMDRRVVSQTVPEGLKVLLHYATADPGTPFRVHLDENQVCEALIGLCMNEGIPLPRRAQKYLQKHKDGIAMTVGLSVLDVGLLKQA